MKLINARSESVQEKPAFRAAYKYRRCLVPANGFYEWQALPGGKQPHYITVQNVGIIAFAGLWESWTDKASGEFIDSFTILTCEANELIQTPRDEELTPNDSKLMSAICLDPRTHGPF